MVKIFPDPGTLPTKSAPKPGHRIVINVSGFPPYKKVGASIRNPRHRHHGRFMKLREAAARAMNGRKWTDDPVSMTVTIYAPDLEKGRDLLSYVGGIMDTLDGSHGYYFTYLPIVYQDDDQVCRVTYRFKKSTDCRYAIEVEFLD